MGHHPGPHYPLPPFLAVTHSPAQAWPSAVGSVTSPACDSSLVISFPKGAAAGPGCQPDSAAALTGPSALPKALIWKDPERNWAPLPAVTPPPGTSQRAAPGRPEAPARTPTQQVTAQHRPLSGNSSRRWEWPWRPLWPWYWP